jgi:hypothetical protein
LHHSAVYLCLVAVTSSLRNRKDPLNYANEKCIKSEHRSPARTAAPDVPTTGRDATPEWRRPLWSRASNCKEYPP